MKRYDRRKYDLRSERASLPGLASDGTQVDAAVQAARALANKHRAHAVALGVGMEYKVSERDKANGAPVWSRKLHAWQSVLRDTQRSDVVEELVGLLERAATGKRVLGMGGHFYRLWPRAVFVTYLVKRDQRRGTLSKEAREEMRRQLRHAAELDAQEAKKRTKRPKRRGTLSKEAREEMRRQLRHAAELDAQEAKKRATKRAVPAKKRATKKPTRGRRR